LFAQEKEKCIQISAQVKLLASNSFTKEQFFSNCGLHFICMESGGATLWVGTWQREKQE